MAERILLAVSPAERDAILAALRLWQGSHKISDELLEIATNGDSHAELSKEEIDALCEGINGGCKQASPKKHQEAIEQRWRERWNAQGFHGKRRLDAQAEFFAGAMAARIDLFGDDAVPPKWFFAIQRGDLIG